MVARPNSAPNTTLMNPRKIFTHVSQLSSYSDEFRRRAYRASPAIRRAKTGIAITVGLSSSLTWIYCLPLYVGDASADHKSN